MHILKKHKSNGGKIVRKKYPNIFKAFDDVIADNVASSVLIKKIRTRLAKGYKIINTDMINPVNVEHFLSKLSVKQRETLTMGDQDETFKKLGKKPGFEDTNELLGEFFNWM